MGIKTSRRGFLALSATAALGAAAGASETKPGTGPKQTSAGKDGKPNLVVIMVDGLQAQRLRLYGGKDLVTRSIDRLAFQGTTFAQAITTCPLCTPARQSLWTGQYPHSFRCVFNNVPMPDDLPHLPQLLKNAGYRTALIGKDHCFHPKLVPQIFDVHWESGHGGAPSHKDDPDVKSYEDIAGLEFLRVAHGQIIDLPGRVTTTARTTERCLEFLNEAGSGPFFVWLSYPEPHSPWVTPREYADMYHPAALALPYSWKCDISSKPAHFRELYDLMGCAKMTEAHIRQLTQIYYGMVSQIDEGVGNVLEMLDKKGLAQNTIVVFTSDHGEYMGNLGMVQKSAHLYDALIRVPLIIRWIGRLPAGSMVDGLVEHHDLMPTLCTLMNIAKPPGIQGVDLTGLLSGASYQRDVVFSEIGFHADRALVKEKTYCPELRWAEARAFYHFVFGHYAHRARCVRTRTHKLVAYEYGERELYDLVTDPEEKLNLYGKPEVATIERDLTELLLQWSITSESPLPDLMQHYDGGGAALRKRLEEGFSKIPDAM